MFKSALGLVILALVVTVVAAGGYYVYATYVQKSAPPVAAPSPSPNAPAPVSQDELNHKRLEGIGSIKTLPPVKY